MNEEKAKEQAILDIQVELRKEHKLFITFREELDAPIKVIINMYLKAQAEKK